MVCYIIYYILHIIVYYTLYDIKHIIIIIIMIIIKIIIITIIRGRSNVFASSLVFPGLSGAPETVSLSLYI